MLAAFGDLGSDRIDQVVCLAVVHESLHLDHFGVVGALTVNLEVVVDVGYARQQDKNQQASPNKLLVKAR